MKEVKITTDCVILTPFLPNYGQLYQAETWKKLLLFCVYNTVMDKRHQVTMTWRQTYQCWVMLIYLTNSLKHFHIFLSCFQLRYWLKTRKNIPCHIKQQLQLIIHETRGIDEFDINTLKFIVNALSKRVSGSTDRYSEIKNRPYRKAQGTNCTCATLSRVIIGSLKIPSCSPKF